MSLAQQTTVNDGNGHSVPLRLYVERIFDEREKTLGATFKAHQDALDLATRSLERQPQMGDARLTALESFRAKALGFGALLALLSGAAGAVIGVVIQRTFG
jgi:hypothetical protein